MKFFSFVYLFIATSIICSECRAEESLPVHELEKKNFSLDANIGYFHPSSKELRRVISGGVNYELLLTYHYTKHLGVVLGGDFFIKDGYSTETRSKSTFWILPVTLGVKVSDDLWANSTRSQVLQGYCLLGPRWYFARATNYSDRVDRHNFAQNIGGVAGIGLTYLYEQFNINLFTNYAYCKLHGKTSREGVETPHTQVGGLTVGAGIEWSF